MSDRVSAESARSYFLPFILGNEGRSHGLSQRIFNKYGIVSLICDSRRNPLTVLSKSLFQQFKRRKHRLHTEFVLSGISSFFSLFSAISPAIFSDSSLIFPMESDKKLILVPSISGSAAAELSPVIIHLSE